MAIASPTDFIEVVSRRTASEFFEGEAWNFGDDVIDRRLEAGRRLAGDVVEDFVEGVTDGEASSDLGDREAGGLAGQGRRPAHPGIHLDHYDVAVVRIDRELDVAAARRDTDLSNDGERLVAQPLVFPVRCLLYTSPSPRD